MSCAGRTSRIARSDEIPWSDGHCWREPTFRASPEMKMETEALVTRAVAAKILGLAVGTLAAMAVDGTGPLMVRLSRRKVRYRPSDLQAWVEARLVKSTSQVSEAQKAEAEKAEREVES